METSCTNQNPSCTGNWTDGDQVPAVHHVRPQQDTASVQWLNTEPESLLEKNPTQTGVPLRKMSRLWETSTGQASGADGKKLQRPDDHIRTQRKTATKNRAPNLEEIRRIAY